MVEKAYEFDAFAGGSDFKRKSRNQSEKRRRDAFNVLLCELAAMVSSCAERKLDKSHVLQKTIEFLHAHNTRTEMSAQVCGSSSVELWKPGFLSSDEFCHLVLDAHDAAVLVFTGQGRVLHASDHCASLLGCSPNALREKGLFDLLDHRERQTIERLFARQASCCVHNELQSLTCKLPAGRGGRKDPLPVRLTGRFKQIGYACPAAAVSPGGATAGAGECGGGACSASADLLCLVCVAKPVEACIRQRCYGLSGRERAVPSVGGRGSCGGPLTEFVTKHDLNFNVIYADARVTPLTGFSVLDLLGTSGYDWLHPDDLAHVCGTHAQLLAGGDSSAPITYRWRTKGSQWLWVRTQLYVTRRLLAQPGGLGDHLVCTHSVVGHPLLHDAPARGGQIKSADMGLGGRLCVAEHSGDTSVSGSSASGEQLVAVKIEHLPIPAQFPLASCSSNNDELQSADALERLLSAQGVPADQSQRSLEQYLLEQQQALQSQISRKMSQLQALRSRLGHTPVAATTCAAAGSQDPPLPAAAISERRRQSPILSASLTGQRPSQYPPPPVT